jgi:hypothetical protein
MGRVLGKSAVVESLTGVSVGLREDFAGEMTSAANCGLLHMALETS